MLNANGYYTADEFFAHLEHEDKEKGKPWIK
jgi:hypothetical protein